MIVHKRLRILATLLSAVLMICSSSVFARADFNEYYDDSYGYCVYIYDEAELFSDREIDKLVDAMEPIAEDYGNVCILTLVENDYSSTERYAKEFTIEYFDRENLVLFIVDTSNRYLYLNFDGEILKKLGSSTGSIITDNVYKYASDDDFYGCAEEAMKEVLIKLEGGNISSSMKIMSNICIAIVLSLLITYYIARAFSTSMKASDSEKLNYMFHDFKFTNVKAKLDHTSREYSPQSSGSGGHGGGGGGGHGGGGGGHGY